MKTVLLSLSLIAIFVLGYEYRSLRLEAVEVIQFEHDRANSIAKENLRLLAEICELKQVAKNREDMCGAYEGTGK